LLEESKRKLEQAEEKLQKALGIDQSRLSTKNHSSKSLTDVLKENRLDAEYWMPKYDRLLERIDKFETATLDTFFKKPIKGIEVGSNEYAEDGMPFVRVSDFSVFGVEKFISKKISQELYQKLKDDYSPNKGELLFTKDGTIGITCVIEDKIEAIISGAFLRLRPKTQVDPHYLALIMNSFICKMQIERLSGGALIAHFKPDDLNKILVPYVGEGIQLVIGDEVRNALALRKKSQQLIDTAKHSIEIFIEQDEKSAIALLKKML
jgi:hypothetical protein